MHLTSSALLATAAVLAATATAGAQELPVQAVVPGCTTELTEEPVRARSLSRAKQETVRLRNQLTAAQLSEVVADPRGWVDPCGAVFYTEPARTDAAHTEPAHTEPEHTGSAGTEEAAVTAAVPADVLSLSSRPGSNRTIYLDFTGDTTTGTAWNQQYGATISSPAYSINAPADANFDEAERSAIHLAWRTVAEDFAPFDVNVTTVEPPADALNRSSSSDQTYGTRVVITATNAVGSACGCGGVAYVNVFDKTNGAYYQPAWVFTSGTGTNGYNAAQAISHEVGHNLGLSHDGTVATATTSARSYYSGANGWAPIMGASYGRRLSQWSNGQYAGASNTQDDVAIIARSAPLLADDHAGGRTGATALAAGVPVTGRIGSRADVDAFSFSAAGSTTLAVRGPAGLSNTDVALTILDASGATVASVDPTSSTASDASLDAVWSATLPATGASYTVLVEGTGNGDPLVAGKYDDYGSLGAYTVTLGAGVLPPPTEPPSEPTPPPTTTTPTTTTPTTTTPTTGTPSGKGVKVPVFMSDRKLDRARRDRWYRELVRFAGPAESVRVVGLPRGLSWREGKRRIVLRGRARRAGEHEVAVVLRTGDRSVRRTFRLRVR